MSTSLPHNRCEVIKLIATDAIVRHDIGCAPVDGFEAAKKIGIRCMPYSTLPEKVRCRAFEASYDGWSVNDLWGHGCIAYNEHMMPERIRFTLLHEIGHITLRHSDHRGAVEEEEANLFAKYALAPPVLVDYFKADTPEKIATRFRLSHEASGYSWNFYHKWRRCTRGKFADYETTLLRHTLWHNFTERCKKIGTAKLPYDYIDEPMFPVSRQWVIFGEGLPWELPAQA